MKLRLLAPTALLSALIPACCAAQDLVGCSQDFDAVIAPALPDGWRNADATAGARWQTLAEGATSGANAAHLADHGARRYQAALLSPAFTVPTNGALVDFRQRRAYSWANTVGVLEIAIAGHAFTDIIAAGGEFLAGGYDGRSFASNPLGARSAWLASPGGYSETRLRLPAAAQGQQVQLRFRAGSTGTGDDSPGWYLDSIVCSSNSVAASTAPGLR